MLSSNVKSVPFPGREYFVLNRVVAVQPFKVVADGSRAKELVGYFLVLVFVFVVASVLAVRADAVSRSPTRDSNAIAMFATRIR